MLLYILNILFWPFEYPGMICRIFQESGKTGSLEVFKPVLEFGFDHAKGLSILFLLAVLK